jgi:hypothetical protein
VARPPLTEPTPRQAAELRAVAEAVAGGLPSPSLPELAKIVDAPHPSSVRADMLILERMGLVGRIAETERFYVPTDAGWAYVGIAAPEPIPTALGVA